MDNAYQQKLQQRAYILHKKWAEIDLGQHDAFYLLAALTLEWSARDVRQALYEHGISSGATSRTDYIRSKSFIPPKTENNETENS